MKNLPFCLSNCLVYIFKNTMYLKILVSWSIQGNYNKYFDKLINY